MSYIHHLHKNSTSTFPLCSSETASVLAVNAYSIKACESFAAPVSQDSEEDCVGLDFQSIHVLGDLEGLRGARCMDVVCEVDEVYECSTAVSVEKAVVYEDVRAQCRDTARPGTPDIAFCPHDPLETRVLTCHRPRCSKEHPCVDAE